LLRGDFDALAVDPDGDAFLPGSGDLGVQAQRVDAGVVAFQVGPEQFAQPEGQVADRGVVHRRATLRDVGDDQVPDRLALQVVTVDALGDGQLPAHVYGLQAGRTADLSGGVQRAPQRLVSHAGAAAGVAQHGVEVGSPAGPWRRAATDASR
jgi:hypothetical protein